MNDKSLKALFFCADSGIPFWGTKGGSIHMREFVGNLEHFGYDISVVARGAGEKGAVQGSTTYYDLPLAPDYQGRFNGDDLDDEGRLMAELARFGNNTEIESFLKNLRANRGFSIIYERYSLFSIAGLRSARNLKLPYVMEVNSPLIEEALKYRRLILKDLAESVERNLFFGADHVIAVSDQIAGYVRKIAPETPISVVPNGVTVENFVDISRSERVESLLTKIKDDDFVIGFIGNLRPWHGVELLIDSFANLPENGRKNKLLIVGGKGKLKSKLKQDCTDRGLKGKVKFTGPVEHEDIPALIERADVLVAPYPELEDFYFSALKLFEYMAAGKPIVASAIGQIEDILTHEKNALLTPPGNIEALGEAILRLKNDSDLRRKLGENARKEAIENHTWKHRLTTVDKIIRGLVEGNRQALPENYENKI